MTITSAPRHAAEPAPDDQPHQPNPVYPLDNHALPIDLPAALSGVGEVVDYLQRAVHPSAGLGAVDVDRLAALLGAVAEITTSLPSLVQRLGDHVDDLAGDPTLRHTEPQRGESPAQVTTAMHRDLLQAEVSAQSLHGLLAHCRMLCGFLTHHRPEGTPRAA